MDSTFKQYKKNEIVYHMEDIPQAIGIVKEGSVVIETVDFLGNVSLLSHIGPNQMFAESYALTKTPMYVYVRAVEDCSIFRCSSLRKISRIKRSNDSNTFK